VSYFNIPQSAVLRWLMRVAGVAAAYYLGGRLGLAIPYIGSHITLIWLPTGIAVAALLRWGYAMWPGVFLGAFLVNLAIGSTPPLAAGIAVGNTLGPLLAAWLLHRNGFHPAFDRRRDILLFGIAASLGMVLSASNGVISLCLAGVAPWSAFAAAWLTWWGGDTVGVLLAGPLLLSLSHASLAKIDRRRGEFLAWAAIMFITAWLVFIANAPVGNRTLPMAFIPLPLIAWAAMRFGVPGTSFGIVMLALLGAWGTASGSGTFYLPDNPHFGLFLLWTYMVSSLLMGILITALVTEGEQAKEVLRRERDFAESLIETAQAIVLVLDPQGRIVRFNAYLESISGRTSKEYAGQDWFGLFLPTRNRESTRALFLQAVQGDIQTRGNVDAILTRSGEERLIEWNDKTLKDADGNIVGLLAVGQDITERKRTEEKLRETQLRLAHIVDTSPTAIYVVKLDPGGTKPPFVSFMSQNITRMVGYPLEEWGQPGFWESHLHPDDRERAIANQALLFEAGKLQHEYRYRHRNGHWLWVHDQLVLEHDEAGQAVEIVGSWLDITGRKQTEEALKRLNENLEQRVAAEAAKSREKDHLLIQQSRLAAMGEMIGNIAHQWRQPINALSLLLGNIEDAYDFGDLTKEELDRQVKTGTRLIQQMSTTIDDFRNFFRPDKEKAPFSLLAALAETREILGASLASHNIVLEEDVPRDITVTGYANEYAQALLNLVNNAKEAILAKHLEAGRIRVEVREENDMAVVRVSDNGGGIPDEVLPKIFDPYFTTKEKGTGIGLYMAKAIIETNMGGRIEVCNRGDGARFTVAVPLG